jgi:hypothetical protein
MQCEGVGEDWVSQLQRQVAAEVSDAELANAAIKYPLNTPRHQGGVCTALPPVR